MPRTTTPERFWAHVQRRGPDDCWPWLGRRDEKGYGRIGFNGQSNRRAHRIAWELVHGVPPVDTLLHSCDHPWCCNPAHLSDGTQLDNIADRDAKGRGTAPPSRRKLTAAEVNAMRRAWADGGITQQQLANRFGVSRGNVSKIVNTKSYKED